MTDQTVLGKPRKKYLVIRRGIGGIYPTIEYGKHKRVKENDTNIVFQSRIPDEVTLEQIRAEWDRWEKKIGKKSRHSSEISSYRRKD